MTISPRTPTLSVGACLPRSPAGTVRFVDTGWAHLASQARRRRATFGYSIAQLSALSGLSTSTLDSIEHARKSSYDPATISALERALHWRIGSVERILKGMEPVPLEDPELEAIIAVWPKLSPGARRMLVILATEGARAEG